MRRISLHVCVPRALARSNGGGRRVAMLSSDERASIQKQLDQQAQKILYTKQILTAVVLRRQVAKAKDLKGAKHKKERQGVYAIIGRLKVTSRALAPRRTGLTDTVFLCHSAGHVGRPGGTFSRRCPTRIFEAPETWRYLASRRGREEAPR